MTTLQAGPSAPQAGLGADYRALFARQWTPWAAGLLIGTVNVIMFAYAKPWGVAEGVQNWGNWALKSVGAMEGTLAAPWVFTTSVTNLAIVAGALIAALLSGEFALRVSYPRDLLRGLLGGILLGVGSVLGIGCTIGGFLTAYSALSLAGPLFMVGLMAGAWLGLRLLMFDLAREKSAKPIYTMSARGWQRYQPAIGAALAVVAVYLLVQDATEFTYAGITGRRSILVLFGLLLGVISQRSRFCFVRAFREPYMTGDGAMTRGVALALLVGVVGFAVIKGTDLSDVRSVEEMVNPSVWLGSLVGGVIFGIGMVLTGGCASGSLWRVGEGQVKFVIVLLAFSVTNAALTLYLAGSGLRDAWGDDSFFLPWRVGWPLALLILLVIPVVWVAVVAWNEKSEKLVVK